MSKPASSSSPTENATTGISDDVWPLLAMTCWTKYTSATPVFGGTTEKVPNFRVDICRLSFDQLLCSGDCLAGCRVITLVTFAVYDQMRAATISVTSGPAIDSSCLGWDMY